MANEDLEKVFGVKLNPNDFLLEKTPEELHALNSEIVFDLYDQLSKWGNPHGKKGESFDAYNNDRSWGIHVAASPFTKTMSIIKMSEDGLARTTNGVFLVKHKMGSILWDRNLTVEQVKEVLSFHDQIAESKGLYNSVTKERLHKEKADF